MLAIIPGVFPRLIPVTATALLLCSFGHVAGANPLYTDVSHASGLPQLGPTRGVCAVDIDLDGDLDLLLNQHANALPLVARQVMPLVFEIDSLRVPAAVMVDHHFTSAFRPAGAGLPVLYLGAGADRGRGAGRNLLLVADGSGWTERSAALGVADAYGRARGGMFLDLIGAPALDLLVLNFRSAPRLFADLDPAMPPADRILGLWPDCIPAGPDPLPGAAPAEVGEAARAFYAYCLVPGFLAGSDPVYIAWGRTTVAYRPGPDRALRAWAEPEVDRVLARRPTHAVIADVDGDLRNDLYLVYGDGNARSDPRFHNELLLQGADGVLRPAAYGDGALLDGTGHRVVAADLDLDGVMDLLVLTRGTSRRERAPAYLRGTGGGSFVDESANCGLAVRRGGIAEEILVADLDGDGDLDVLIAQGDHDNRAATGGYRLFRNGAADAGAGGAEFWLAGGARSNPEAYGARMRFRSGRHAWVRDHWPVQSGGSSMPLPVHLGVGAVARLDSVTVTWPSGVTEVALGLDAHRTWFWREGEPPRQLPRP